jgi:hypothetical protein
MHVAQTLADAGQAVQCPLFRGNRELAFIIKAFGQPDRFLQAINDRKLAVAKLADDQVKAVGTEIDGSNNFGRGVTVSFACRYVRVGDLIDRSDGEGRAATAGRGRVGVSYDELGALQILFIIDLGTHEVLKTHRIDDQSHALILHAGITFFLFLVEGKAVLETGTTSACHEHSQHQVRIVFLLDQFADFPGGSVRKNDRRRGRNRAYDGVV